MATFRSPGSPLAKSQSVWMILSILIHKPTNADRTSGRTYHLAMRLQIGILTTVSI